MNYHPDNTLAAAHTARTMRRPAGEMEFFDAIAEKWDSMEVKSTPAKVRYILSRCDIGRGDSVLDLGTGTGVLIPYLYERAGREARVTAVDFSRNMLDIARRKYSGISPCLLFLQSDMETDILPGRYDHIMLYCVYPHLQEPMKTLRHLLKENLKPEGSLWIAFPTDASFINAIHDKKESEADRLPSASELTLLLLSEGFHASMIEDTTEAFLIRIQA